MRAGGAPFSLSHSTNWTFHPSPTALSPSPLPSAPTALSPSISPPPTPLHDDRIRELGSLPADAFEKYKGKSSKSLHKQLEKVAADLAKFGSVNRKALDQYTSFTEQREELSRRWAAREFER